MTSGDRPGDHGPSAPAQAVAARIPAPHGASESAGVKLAAPILGAGFVVVFACLFVFGTLAEGVRSQEVFALDQFATPFLHRFTSPALDAVMETATFIGSNVVVVPAFVVAFTALLVVRRRREAVLLAMALGGSLVLNGVMKPLFHRPRPQLPWAHVLPDYSFPSGHSMNSMAFFVALAVVAWLAWGRRAGVAAMMAAIGVSLLIGVSRIYLGYHYLTDVVGGFSAALLWLAVTAGAIAAGDRARSRWWRRDDRGVRPE